MLDIISASRLDKFYRTSEVSAAYARAKVDDAAQYGSTADFVKMQLGWEGERARASAAPFLGANSDVKILLNRFPYDLEPGVEHLVVWSKVPIPIEVDTHVSAGGKRLIEAFVDHLFVGKYGIPRKDIAWFKNPTPLQTIPSIAHFHVLVRNAGPKIEAILNDTKLVEW